MNLDIPEERLPVPSGRNLKKKLKHVLKMASHSSRGEEHSEDSNRVSVIKSTGRVHTLASSVKNSYETTYSEVAKLIDDYKKHFIKVNKVVSKDFNGGLQVKINDCKLEEDSLVQLDKYIQDIKAVNIEDMIQDLLEGIDKMIVNNTVKSKVKKHMYDWHQNFLVSWDDKVECVIMEQIEHQHSETCKKEFGIYNFTNHVIKEEDKQLLKQGKKVVLPLKMTKYQSIERIKKECLDYAIRYAKTKYIERQTNLELEEQLPVTDVLERLAANSSNPGACAFYRSLQGRLQDASSYKI